MIEKSLESQLYLNAFSREQAAFERLIVARSKMPQV